MTAGIASAYAELRTTPAPDPETPQHLCAFVPALIVIIHVEPCNAEIETAPAIGVDASIMAFAGYVTMPRLDEPLANLRELLEPQHHTDPSSRTAQLDPPLLDAAMMPRSGFVASAMMRVGLTTSVVPPVVIKPFMLPPQHHISLSDVADVAPSVMTQVVM